MTNVRGNLWHLLRYGIHHEPLRRSTPEQRTWTMEKDDEVVIITGEHRRRPDGTLGNRM